MATTVLPVTGNQNRRMRELSESRTNIYLKFHAEMHNSNGDSSAEEAIRAFRCNFVEMGFGDQIVDLFFGRAKARMLDSLALCHIASFPAGRDYLAKTGELAQAAEGSRHLLRNLDANIRQEMLQSPVVSPGGLILLTFPNANGLSMPLFDKCFGDGDGALSEVQAKQLIGQTVHGRDLSCRVLDLLAMELGARNGDLSAPSAAIALLSRAAAGTGLQGYDFHGAQLVAPGDGPTKSVVGLVGSICSKAFEAFASAYVGKMSDDELNTAMPESFALAGPSRIREIGARFHDVSLTPAELQQHMRQTTKLVREVGLPLDSAKGVLYAGGGDDPMEGASEYSGWAHSLEACMCYAEAAKAHGLAADRFEQAGNSLALNGKNSDASFYLRLASESRSKFQTCSDLREKQNAAGGIARNGGDGMSEMSPSTAAGAANYTSVKELRRQAALVKLQGEELTEEAAKRIEEGDPLGAVRIYDKRAAALERAADFVGATQERVKAAGLYKEIAIAREAKGDFAEAWKAWNAAALEYGMAGDDCETATNDKEGAQGFRDEREYTRRKGREASGLVKAAPGARLEYL